MSVKKPAKRKALAVPLYLDTSVILRWMLNENNSVRVPDDALFYASVLLRVESRRTLDRLHRQAQLSASALAESEHWLAELEDQIAWVPLSESVQSAAAKPLRTIVGTLDAFHLVSAIAVRQSVSNLAFATHDKQLGIAAAAHGFTVLGV